MDGFEEILKAGNYQSVLDKMDEASFVAYYLLNEYMETCDFKTLSVYFYYKDNKLYAGPAWDFDNSSGNFFVYSWDEYKNTY